MIINYDKNKIKEVNISEVNPNPWNPKDLGTASYDKVLMTIKQRGFLEPIVVRQTEWGYEILDGEQRWRVMKDLGKEKILIYNEGQVEDNEAKRMTINYIQQAPFTPHMLAQLVVDELIMHTDIQLPLPDGEIEDLKALREQEREVPFTPEGGGGETEDEFETHKRIRCYMTAEDLSDVEFGISHMREKIKVSEEEALTEICLICERDHNDGNQAR